MSYKQICDECQYLDFKYGYCIDKDEPVVNTKLLHKTNHNYQTSRCNHLITQEWLFG